MKKKLFFIALFLSFVLAPGFRTCGKISYGFPAVAIEADTPVSVKHIKLENALIDLVLVSLVFLAAIYLLSRSSRFRRPFKYGLKGIYWYQAFLWFSYLVLYWGVKLSDNIIAVLYVLYPFCSNLLHLSNSPFNRFSASSPLFGNDYDIIIRLNYAASLVLCFAMGLAAYYIKRPHQNKNEQRTKYLAPPTG